MRRTFRTLLLLSAPLLLIGCASTRITSSWADPRASGFKPKSAMVLVISPNEVTRRSGEDELAGLLPGLHAAPAYRLLTEPVLKDKDATMKALKAKGVDAVILLRFAGVQRELNWAPGMYPTFWGYYRWAWAESPAWAWTDTTVWTEVRVYQVSTDKLVWAGVFQTFDPKSPQDAIAQVARSAAEALQKAGLAS